MEMRAIDVIFWTAFLTCLSLAWAQRRLRHRLRSQSQELREVEKTVAELQARLNKVNDELRETRDQVGLLEPPPAARSGMNITTRTSAIRLHRNGKNEMEIADALRVPQQEIRLLLKVHQLSRTRLEKEKDLGKHLRPV